MRIGEIVGGVALVGVAVLVGIALTDDGDSRDHHGGHLAVRVRRLDLAGTTASTAATAPPTPPRRRRDDRAVAHDGRVAAPAADRRPPTTAAPTTDVDPARAARRDRRPRPQRRCTGPRRHERCRRRCATPASPRRGRRRRRGSCRRPRVLFAPGRELDAATVNDVVRARPENVVPASRRRPELGGVRRRPRRAGRARTGRNVTSNLLRPTDGVVVEPIEYVRALIRRWPIIAIGALIGAAFAFVGTDPEARADPEHLHGHAHPARDRGTAPVRRPGAGRHGHVRPGPRLRHDR